MFSLAVLALASFASSANALVIPRSQIPPTYAVGYLEDYYVYHTRYLALKCETKHSTDFFDRCCHPMLATENLDDNRDPDCKPAPEASSSAAAAEPTSTIKLSPGDDVPKNVADTPKNVAPEPSPAKEDKPKPSEDPKPAPKPAPKPQAPSDNGGDQGGLSGIVGKMFSHGIATYFFQNGVAGACGTVHEDSAFIVALETSTYANGAHCGKKVKLQDVKTGHTEIATVADECPTCNNPQSVDLSAKLFDAFASRGDGVFDLKWGFVDN